MTSNKKFIICSLVIVATFTFVFCGIKTIAQERQNQEIYDYCVEIGGYYNISPELIYAICERESSLQPNVSNGECCGLMQVSSRWHSSRMADLGVTDLYDARSNILVGTDLLYDYFKEYQDVGVVLGKYHGETNAEWKAENNQLSSYTLGILERARELEIENGK